tara:strand:+ start:1814 stop:2407 length:594 start_codon:yes stop_codon:yes gene_type:complete
MKSSNRRQAMCVIALILGLFAVGCQTVESGFYDPDGLIVPEVSIPSIPVKNESNVRLPESIKAYPIGRYQDPSDPRIMHERHVIYRREFDSDWRLSANSGRQILIGPTMTDAPLDQNPALLEKELAIEVQRQRELSAKQEETNEFLSQQNAALSQVILLMNERLKMLEKSNGGASNVDMSLSDLDPTTLNEKVIYEN